MDDAGCGNFPSARYANSEEYQSGYAYGQSLIEQQHHEAAERAYYESVQAELETEYIRLECEHYQHEPYHGARDRFGVRCYCGKVRWLEEVDAE